MTGDGQSPSVLYLATDAILGLLYPASRLWWGIENDWGAMVKNVRRASLGSWPISTFTYFLQNYTNYQALTWILLRSSSQTTITA